MPTFQYRAVDGRGAVVKGTLTAVDQAAALAQLRSKGELPIRVAPQGVVERVKITNVEPVPPAVSRCVESRLKREELPEFEGSRAEIFGLTVVL